MSSGLPQHPCQVCNHPDRLGIEMALANGKSAREVARTFHIGSNVGTPEFLADHKKVTKHWADHSPEAVRAAKEAGVIQAGVALVSRMDELDDAVNATLRRALRGEVVRDADGHPVMDTESGDYLRRYPERVILAAVAEGRRNAEVRARLEGVGPEGDQDAVEQARALLGSPEARRMVTELEGMAGGV